MRSEFAPPMIGQKGRVQPKASAASTFQPYKRLINPDKPNFLVRGLLKSGIMNEEKYQTKQTVKMLVETAKTQLSAQDYIKAAESFKTAALVVQNFQNTKGKHLGKPRKYDLPSYNVLFALAIESKVHPIFYNVPLKSAINSYDKHALLDAALVSYDMESLVAGRPNSEIYGLMADCFGFQGNEEEHLKMLHLKHHAEKSEARAKAMQNSPSQI